MSRRALRVVGAVLLGLLAASCRLPTAPPAPPPGVVARLVAQNDAAIPGLLARQRRDPGAPSHGGIPEPNGLYFPGTTAAFVRDLAAAFCAPHGRHARSPRLLSAMADATAYLLRVQHADGTIDLPTTNFHSPPDTGFALEWLCAAAALLRATDDPAAAPLQDALLTFIRRAADALANGGVHTPNHRWVVGMALARANALVPDPRYTARIDTWLHENIDIDPDGQFTERSTTIYSPLSARCLITMARLLGREELLAPVRDNLAMTLHYLHADGQVATEGSRRQDQYQRGSLAACYYPYRYLAQRDGDGRFAAVARRLEADEFARLGENLIWFLESPALGGPLPANAPLPDDFERHFAHSDLVRIRRGALSATILADNPTFFSLHLGRAALALRFASAFFGKGQFVGTGLRKDGDAWLLEQELEGPYYQPIAPEHRRADGDWLAMDRALRPQSEVQRLRSVVRIRERPGGFDVEIEITGTDGVPIAIELGCPADGTITGAEAIAEADDCWLMTAGAARLAAGADHIDVSGGQAAHAWTQLRGALPKLPGKSVYATGLTPFRRTLQLR
jgi:hypothetical protein